MYNHYQLHDSWASTTGTHGHMHILYRKLTIHDYIIISIIIINIIFITFFTAAAAAVGSSVPLPVISCKIDKNLILNNDTLYTSFISVTIVVRHCLGACNLRAIEIQIQTRTGRGYPCMYNMAIASSNRCALSIFGRYCA